MCRASVGGGWVGRCEGAGGVIIRYRPVMDVCCAPGRGTEGPCRVSAERVQVRRQSGSGGRSGCRRCVVGGVRQGAGREPSARHGLRSQSAF